MMTYLEALPLKCRLGGTPTNGRPDVACGEFCRYDFPRCAGCPYTVRPEPICNSFEDPMKSVAVRGWIRGISRLSK
jgi:hypothetical protein